MPSAAGSFRDQRPRHLPARDLAQVAGRLGVALPAEAQPGLAVTGLTHDSRSVRPGDLYVALPGARFHGADFTAAAVAAGAVAVVTDPAGAAAAGVTGVPVLVVAQPRRRLGALAAWLYGEPAQAMTVLGVTGTNGKTTTAYLAEAGLRAAGRRTGLIGTVETRIGAETLPSVRTTPEAPDLQALLARMREDGVDSVVMEISSHALALGRVDGLVADVAVFTNLSQDHLDFHADIEDYFAAKAALFTPERSRLGVVNVDDGYGARLAAQAGVPIVTVSPGGAVPTADWVVAATTAGPWETGFELRGPDGQRVPASVGLPGGFNVANAALAVVALAAAGVPAETAAAGVADCTGVPGRMERVVAGQEFTAVVDYAHTPDAVATLLDALRPVTKGALLLVLGCGGDRDRGKRAAMGEVAARGADLVVLTNDNPRSEDPLDILAALSAGTEQVPAGERAVVHVIPDRAAAIAKAVAVAGPADTVVVAGKGHEQGQEVAGVVHPFDDRDELRAQIGLVLP